MNPLIPVWPIKASQEWLDRVEANPAHYQTPEGRLLLQLPRQLSPLPPRGMAILRIGDEFAILDERTEEERAADISGLSSFLDGPEKPR